MVLYFVPTLFCTKLWKYGFFAVTKYQNREIYFKSRYQKREILTNFTKHIDKYLFLLYNMANSSNIEKIIIFM